MARGNRSMQQLQSRLIEVWGNWIKQSDAKELKEIATDLNDWLDEWNSEDRFGTEGQLDPRGDTRDSGHPYSV